MFQLILLGFSQEVIRSSEIRIIQLSPSQFKYLVFLFCVMVAGISDEQTRFPCFGLNLMGWYDEINLVDYQSFLSPWDSLFLQQSSLAWGFVFFEVYLWWQLEYLPWSILETYSWVIFFVPQYFIMESFKGTVHQWCVTIQDTLTRVIGVLETDGGENRKLLQK